MLDYLASLILIDLRFSKFNTLAGNILSFSKIQLLLQLLQF